MKNSTTKVCINDLIQQKEKFAKMFSEGNNNLEICLLKLWNNNIYTIGCCAGHSEKVPYIGIDLNNSNINNVITLLNNLKKDNIKLTFTSNTITHYVGIKGIDINDKTIFNNITDSINNISKSDEFKEQINEILNWNNGYINYQYIYKNNILVSKYCATNNSDKIKEFIDKYNYKVLNEKNNYYSFKLI